MSLVLSEIYLYSLFSCNMIKFMSLPTMLGMYQGRQRSSIMDPTAVTFVGLGMRSGIGLD